MKALENILDMVGTLACVLLFVVNSYLTDIPMMMFWFLVSAAKISIPIVELFHEKL